MGQLIIEKVEGEENKPEYLQVNPRKQEVKGRMRTFDIKDGEFHVVLIPALNFTGYGKTKKQAMAMLREVLEDYFETLLALDKNAISFELRKYGWAPHRYFHKKYHYDSYVDKHGILRNLNLPEETPIEEFALQVA